MVRCIPTARQTFSTIRGPDRAAAGQRGPPPACDAPDSGAAGLMRRFSLAQEHHATSTTSCGADGTVIPDEALIARLKKKKLHLKDEMVRLEAALAA